MGRLRRFLPPLLTAAAAAGLVPSLLSPSDLPCHRDLLDFVVPLKVHFARCVASGEWPWWDPFTLGGRPFFATLQSQVLYPPNWLHLVLDLPWALSIFLAFHLWWAGEGARRLARTLGAGTAAALLAGVAYLAGGFVASLTDLSNQLCAAAWLPWTCLAASRFAAQPRARRLAVWSLCVLASFLAAAPQHAALGGLTSLAFATLAASGPARRRLGLALIGGALACTLALLAGSVQLVPFARLVLDSDRASGEALAAPGRHELEARALISLVRAPEDALDAPGGALVRSLYLGPLVLVPALLGALTRSRTALLLVALALLSAWLAAGTGLPGPSRWLVEATPFLRYPIKNAGIAALALPLLAALGLDALLRRLRESGRVERPLLLLLAATVPLATAADLVRAHRPLFTALPVHRVLAPTPAIEMLAANTRADGPRVHSLPLTRERLKRRARLLATHGAFAATRDRVELLEGGLPAVFGIHSTWGAATVTPRERAELLSRAAGPAAIELATELGAGFVLAPAGSRLPLPRAPAAGGAAELYLLVPLPDFPEREWLGPNRAIGPPDLPPPSRDPGWREGPAGTWSYRPAGLTALVLLSLAGGLLLALLWTGRTPWPPALSSVDRPEGEASPG